MRVQVIGLLLAAGSMAGVAAASGVSNVSYKVETETKEGGWAEAGTLELSGMTPNLAGWKGTFKDSAGAETPAYGIDSSMLSGRSGDYMALAIGARLCLVESVEPETSPRTYTASCKAPDDANAVPTRLTETGSDAMSVEAPPK